MSLNEEYIKCIKEFCEHCSQEENFNKIKFKNNNTVYPDFKDNFLEGIKELNQYINNFNKSNSNKLEAVDLRDLKFWINELFLRTINWKKTDFGDTKSSLKRSDSKTNLSLVDVLRASQRKSFLNPKSDLNTADASSSTEQRPDSTSTSARSSALLSRVSISSQLSSALEEKRKSGAIPDLTKNLPEKGSSLSTILEASKETTETAVSSPRSSKSSDFSSRVSISSQSSSDSSIPPPPPPRRLSVKLNEREELDSTAEFIHPTLYRPIKQKKVKNRESTSTNLFIEAGSFEQPKLTAQTGTVQKLPSSVTSIPSIGNNPELLSLPLARPQPQASFPTPIKENEHEKKDEKFYEVYGLDKIKEPSYDSKEDQSLNTALNFYYLLKSPEKLLKSDEQLKKEYPYENGYNFAKKSEAEKSVKLKKVSELLKNSINKNGYYLTIYWMFVRDKSGHPILNIYSLEKAGYCPSKKDLRRAAIIYSGRKEIFDESGNNITNLISGYHHNDIKFSNTSKTKEVVCIEQHLLIYKHIYDKLQFKLLQNPELTVDKDLISIMYREASELFFLKDTRTEIMVPRKYSLVDPKREMRVKPVRYSIQPLYEQVIAKEEDYIVYFFERIKKEPAFSGRFEVLTSLDKNQLELLNKIYAVYPFHENINKAENSIPPLSPDGALTGDEPIPHPLAGFTPPTNIIPAPSLREELWPKEIKKQKNEFKVALTRLKNFSGKKYFEQDITSVEILLNLITRSDGSFVKNSPLSQKDIAEDLLKKAAILKEDLQKHIKTTFGHNRDENTRLAYESFIFEIDKIDFTKIEFNKDLKSFIPSETAKNIQAYTDINVLLKDIKLSQEDFLIIIENAVAQLNKSTQLRVFFSKNRDPANIKRSYSIDKSICIETDGKINECYEEIFIYGFKKGTNAPAPKVEVIDDNKGGFKNVKPDCIRILIPDSDKKKFIFERYTTMNRLKYVAKEKWVDTGKTIQDKYKANLTYVGSRNLSTGLWDGEAVLEGWDGDLKAEEHMVFRQTWKGNPLENYVAGLIKGNKPATFPEHLEEKEKFENLINNLDAPFHVNYVQKLNQSDSHNQNNLVKLFLQCLTQMKGAKDKDNKPIVFKDLKSQNMLINKNCSRIEIIDYLADAITFHSKKSLNLLNRGGLSEEDKLHLSIFCFVLTFSQIVYGMDPFYFSDYPNDMIQANKECDDQFEEITGLLKSCSTKFTQLFKNCYEHKIESYGDLLERFKEIYDENGALKSVEKLQVLKQVEYVSIDNLSAFKPSSDAEKNQGYNSIEELLTEIKLFEGTLDSPNFKPFIDIVKHAVYQIKNNVSIEKIKTFYKDKKLNKLDIKKRGTKEIDASRSHGLTRTYSITKVNSPEGKPCYEIFIYGKPLGKSKEYAGSFKKLKVDCLKLLIGADDKEFSFERFVTMNSIDAEYSTNKAEHIENKYIVNTTKLSDDGRRTLQAEFSDEGWELFSKEENKHVLFRQTWKGNGLDKYMESISNDLDRKKLVRPFIACLSEMIEMNKTKGTIFYDIKIANMLINRDKNNPKITIIDYDSKISTYLAFAETQAEKLSSQQGLVNGIFAYTLAITQCVFGLNKEYFSYKFLDRVKKEEHLDIAMNIIKPTSANSGTVDFEFAKLFNETYQGSIIKTYEDLRDALIKVFSIDTQFKVDASLSVSSSAASGGIVPRASQALIGSFRASAGRGHSL